MAIYTGSKSAPGTTTPDRGIDAAAWSRTEPLLTPQRIRDEFCFGIPLVSQVKDPITGRAAVMTNPLIERFINRAVSKAEAETGATIFPVQFQEKKPFDKCEYESFGYFKLENRPVTSVEKCAVTPTDDTDIFVVPTDWLEVNYLRKGQLNIIPVTAALSNSVQVGSAGGAVFLQLLGTRFWIPAFWQITYTAGYEDGKIPVLVNELIGTIAAMDILSTLATTHAIDTSFSLGIDGMSQSVSTAGPQVFKVRMDELALERKTITKKIKKSLGLAIVSGNV